MRNLLLFITRYHYFFLFILLELIALVLLVQNNYYQKASFINTSNQVTGRIHQGFTSVTEYFSLRETNDRLMADNADLKNRLKTSFFSFTPAGDTITDTLFRQKYQFVSAKVVSNTTHKQNNYLTLNRGSAHGVKKGMGVISSDGVVGIVKDVSENFSSVMSVLHQKVLIPSMVKKYREPGILKWDGRDGHYAILPNIPRHLKLVRGDTIMTSHSSSVFPEGTMVGVIEEINDVQGNTFYDLKVRLSTDFGKLNYAYIVIYLFKDEQDALEERSQNDK